MGFGELALVLIIVAVVFGSLKLPPLADRIRYARAREAREARFSSADWVFIGAIAVVLSLAFAVAMVVFSRQR
jgi:hypothetical protein